jgi:hypothetical protein
MTPSSLYSTKLVPRVAAPAARWAAEWLSLAAAPAFAIMALLTGLHGSAMPNAPDMGMQDPSPLAGMTPMYVLMSVFHFRPWLRLVSRETVAREPAAASSSSTN